MGELLSNPLVWLIGASEVGFWVLLGTGLLARYLLRLRRVSAVLLVLVPVLDLVLIGAALADVAGGSPPGQVHGLAAVYLGGTVAFGHSLIRWADARFAHRFACGPPPPTPPKYGRAKVAYEWREWSKMALLVAIAVVVMALTALVAGSGIPPIWLWSGDPMWGWASRTGVVAVIWLVFWPVWATIAPPREPVGADDDRR